MKASPDMPLIPQNDESSKSLEDELNSQNTGDKQEGAGVVEESCVLTATSTDSEISRAVVDKSSYEATSSKIVTSRAISNHSEVGSSEGLDEPTTVDAAGADVETKKVGLPRTELPTSTPSPTDAGSVMSQGTSHGIDTNANLKESTCQDETTEDKNMLPKPVPIPKAEQTKAPGESHSKCDRSTPPSYNYTPRDGRTNAAASVQQNHPPRQQPFQARPPFSHTGRGGKFNQERTS